MKTKRIRNAPAFTVTYLWVEGPLQYPSFYGVVSLEPGECLGRKEEVDMEFFDRAVLLALFALLAGCLYLGLKAVYRYYHWRRSLQRIERREWVRTVRSLRSSEEAY